MKTILLVDNDPNELKSHGSLLSQLGYDVIAETGGRSALTLLRSGAEVGAVITECRLTDMDGAEFLMALRRHAPSTPVIVLTAHGTVEGYLRCLDLGVFEYANKPLRPPELERIVTAALGPPRSDRRDAA